MTAPTVGIIGGGQLARMTAQAAISLAVDTHVLALDERDPACSVATSVTLGDPNDLEVLLRFAQRCDVVTLDHERVELGALLALESAGHVVRPGAAALRYADKAHQRAALGAMGFRVPPFRVVTAAWEIDAFAADHRWPLVVKAARGGYDGRGVHVVASSEDAAIVAAALGGRHAVVEPLLEIEREIAVVVARRASGEEMVAYPVVETVQRDGICVETLAPARVDEATAVAATDVARRIAVSVDAVGILAVELFVTAEGIQVNELAPRPHNSAHWTIEGAATSQFENHLRAVLDWPLGGTRLTAAAVAMANVLGTAAGNDPTAELPRALEVPGASIHLYAKEARVGRKVGHVTALADDGEMALARARAAAGALTGAQEVATNGGAR